MDKLTPNQRPALSEIVQVELLKGTRQPLQRAYLVATKALLPLIARYLRRQQIKFKVSSPLDIEKSRPARIIVIGPNSRDNSKTVPSFLLSYLQELPLCQLFYRLSLTSKSDPEKAIEGSGFMVEYGFHYPLPLPDIADHLETKNLYLISGDRKTPTLVIKPAPILKNESTLSRPVSSIELSLKSIHSNGDSDQKSPLQLNLQLINDPQNRQPTQALYLKNKEIKWLEKLYKRLPGPLLDRIRWAGDQEHAILLLPEDQELSFFPFGEPLKRVTNKLFLPLKQRLSPQLSSLQIEKTLGLAPNKLTILTKQWRFDIAENDFQALDKMIYIKTTPPKILEFSDPEEPFEFIWKNHNDALETATSDAMASQKPGAVEPAKEQESSPLTIARSRENTNQDQGSANHTSTTPTEILKEYALKLRRQNDFLGAATCFSLAEEPLPAAECYRLAALSLEQQ